MMHAHAQMSTAVDVCWSLSNCSGAMYCAVPPPAAVVVAVAVALALTVWLAIAAIPKSEITAVPASTTAGY
jgi:hypothetical protein